MRTTVFDIEFDMYLSSWARNGKQPSFLASQCSLFPLRRHIILVLLRPCCMHLACLESWFRVDGHEECIFYCLKVSFNIELVG